VNVENAKLLVKNTKPLIQKASLMLEGKRCQII